MKTLEAQGWAATNQGAVAEVKRDRAEVFAQLAQVQKIKEHYQKERQRYIQEGVMASSSWRELKGHLMQQKMELAHANSTDSSAQTGL